MKITSEEWKKKSENGDVCGILGCDDKPIVQCTLWKNWYCEGHKFMLNLPGHQIEWIDIVAEK